MHATLRTAPTADLTVPARDVLVGSGARDWRTVGGMKKRVLATVLWFYAGWYTGAMIASLAGLSPVLGPILAVAAAGIIAGDPRRLIWTRPSVVKADRQQAEPA